MRLVVILLTLFTCYTYGQDLAAFNAVYRKTFLETSQKDFNRAVQVADSLFSISQSPILKIKSLMLSATLYDQSGDFEKSLQYATKAEEITDDTDEIIWRCKIYGFLATHYRYVRLFTKSKKYADLCLLTIHDIKDHEVQYGMYAMVEQEKAYYEIEKKNYNKSVSHLIRAQNNLNKSKINNDFSKITNSQLLGLNYYHLNQLDKSLKYYFYALDKSKNLPENYMTGLIHNGLSLIYLKKSQTKKTKKHLDIAQRIADESKYLSLQNEVYQTSEKYYSATKDVEELTKTKEKREGVRIKLLTNSQSFVNNSFTKIDEENIKVKGTNILKNLILGFCIIFISVAAAFIFIYRKRSKKEIESYKKLLTQSDDKSIFVSKRDSDKLSVEDTLLEEEVLTEDSFTVPEITVAKILHKLNDFENSKSFLENSTSLPNLAGYCETNTKYLSYVIRVQKKKDFSSYINELRVNYIIEKLRKISKYRNYKIAALAEESGFSSPNKFATIFKKITGCTPSSFIKHLDEAEKVDY